MVEEDHNFPAFLGYKSRFGMEAFDYRDPALFTPMMGAVIRNDLKTFRMYMEKGWSVNNIDNKGNTPLHLSILLKKNEIFDYILSLDSVRADVQNFEQVTPLHMAAYHSNYEAGVALLQLDDVDVNAKDHELNTPLHFAAAHKHMGLVRELLEHGADVNAINYDDKTPILYAVEEGCPEMVALLIEHGAFVHISQFIDCKAELSRCPFVYAIDKLHDGVAGFLYEYTFDHVDNAVPLGVLCQVLPIWEFAQVEDLVKRIDRLLVYDEANEYTSFAHAITDVPPRTLEMLLSRFQPTMKKMFQRGSKDWLLCWCRTVSTLGQSNIANVEEEVWRKLEALTGILAMMAEHEVLTDFCRALAPYPVIDTLVNFFHWTDVEHRPELDRMVMMLLSYGMNLYSCDMLSLYNYQHWDIFKRCLHMDVLPLPESIPTRGASILPLLIFDIPNTTLEFFYENNPENYAITDQFLATFSGQRLKRLTGLDWVEDVPRLCELARNAARNALLTKARTCAQFHNAVKSLDITQVAKDILTLDRRLYF